MAANLLHRSGWDVHVYERVAEPLVGRGAGIATHPELFEALRRCGVVVDNSIGVDVQYRITLDQCGAVIGKRWHPQVRSEQERAMAERCRRPEAVMRETAVPPGLGESA